jgi:IS30 family transposase
VVWVAGERFTRLSFDERGLLKEKLLAGWSLRQIAALLDRPTSTISREVARNGGRRSYHLLMAQHRALAQAKRPQPFKLESNGPLAKEVARLLGLRWSPEQISKRLRRDHPGDERWWVSGEAIYQSLFIQGRGGLNSELTKALRSGRAKRRSPPAQDGRGQLRDMVLVSERPGEAEDRAVPGHWEGDLIIGVDRRSAVITLVERTSRYVLAAVLPTEHTAATTRAALTELIATLPAHLRRSLTWDRGKEMAEHPQLRIDADIAVYFCEPGKPWQRGTNENTNRLLRQYLPKGTSFTDLTNEQPAAVTAELNGRPRKTLGWDTPAEAYTQALQATLQ